MPSGVVPRTSTSSAATSYTMRVPAPGSSNVVLTFGPSFASSPVTAITATAGLPVSASVVVA